MEIDEIESRVSKLEADAKQPKKDLWDRLGAVSGLASGILVALIGFYATNIYDRNSKEGVASLGVKKIGWVSTAPAAKITVIGGIVTIIGVVSMVLCFPEPRITSANQSRLLDPLGLLIL